LNNKIFDACIETAIIYGYQSFANDLICMT